MRIRSFAEVIGAKGRRVAAVALVGTLVMAAGCGALEVPEWLEEAKAEIDADA